MEEGRFLFLGTGGAAGVPQIGCECYVCRSKEPRNQRLRAAGQVTIGPRKLLIDAGPDLRTQALRYELNQLSAVIITHAHADHIAGIDDLRPYYFLQKQRLPCVVSAETFSELRQRYPYLMEELSAEKSVSAQIDFQELPADRGSYEIAGIPFTYFSYYQIGTKVTGIRIGSLAYVTDIRLYSHDVLQALQGVDVLIISGPRREESSAHFGLHEVVDFAHKVSAKKCYVTHISHELEHKLAENDLPPEVRLAYDGLEIPFCPGGTC